MVHLEWSLLRLGVSLHALRLVLVQVHDPQVWEPGLSVLLQVLLQLRPRYEELVEGREQVVEGPQAYVLTAKRDVQRFQGGKPTYVSRQRGKGLWVVRDVELSQRLLRDEDKLKVLFCEVLHVAQGKLPQLCAVIDERENDVVLHSEVASGQVQSPEEGEVYQALPVEICARQVEAYETGLDLEEKFVVEVLAAGDS